MKYKDLLMNEFGILCYEHYKKRDGAIYKDLASMDWDEQEAYLNRYIVQNYRSSDFNPYYRKAVKFGLRLLNILEQRRDNE